MRHVRALLSLPFFIAADLLCVVGMFIGGAAMRDAIRHQQRKDAQQ